MKQLKYSVFVKFFIHSCLLGSLCLMFFSSLKIANYLSHYSQASNFYETYAFEERYSKYMERVASYIRYSELGYLPDNSYIINSNLPTDTYYFLNERDDDQNTFEFYDKKLNKDKTNFIYYVKNTVTGKEYYSPFLKENFGSIDRYCEMIMKAPTYFVLNTKNGVYSTNLTNWGHLSSYDVDWIVECLTGKSMTGKLSGSQQAMESSTVLMDTISEENQSNSLHMEYLVYTSILSSIPYQEDDFYPLYQIYLNALSSYQKNLILLPVSFLVFLTVLLLAIANCGHRPKKEEIVLLPMDHLFTELTLILPFAGILLLYQILKHSRYLNQLKKIVSLFTRPDKLSLFFSVFLILYPWVAFWLFCCIRKFKAHTFWKSFFIYKVYDVLKCSYLRFRENAPITYHVAFYFIIFFCFNLFSIYCYIKISSYGVIITLISFLFAFYFLNRYASDFHIIVKETKKIAEGDINRKIPESQLRGSNKTLAGYINHIGDGLSIAVEEQLKSECLKTELITNVSHDIKTPLTSIINYVDLLKKENLENDKANEYIQILETKSWRLKTLIEDLVEASKASSGSIHLQLARINIVELIQQSAGEFDDRFAKRNLEVVINLPEEPIYIQADGRYTFRMIENIFSNAYKYAMAGTRIYVDIEKAPVLPGEAPKVTVSVKNISSNKLNIPSSELMERFVRGDLSRNTEGSGLGLSIVKSLSELQNVGFEMFLDGDLFKVVFTFAILEDKTDIGDLV